MSETRNTKPLFPFNEWLGEELAITGMTQEELAIDADMDKGQISKYVSGKTDPRISSVERILKTLGYSLKNVTGDELC